MSRDYSSEYRARITRGLRLGLSRSAARGHPTTLSRVSYDRELELGVKLIREGRSLSAAARTADVSSERLRAYLKASGIATREGRRWVIGEDRRPRVVPIFSRGRRYELTVPNYAESRLAGAYMQTVYGPFLETNDPAVLAEFAGRGVHDRTGRFYPFELRPNELYRLSLAGPEPYEQIYQIVM